MERLRRRRRRSGCWSWTRRPPSSAYPGHHKDAVDDGEDHGIEVHEFNELNARRGPGGLLPLHIQVMRDPNWGLVPLPAGTKMLTMNKMIESGLMVLMLNKIEVEV